MADCKFKANLAAERTSIKQCENKSALKVHIHYAGKIELSGTIVSGKKLVPALTTQAGNSNVLVSCCAPLYT